ncbi:MAG: hypothetical protein ACP5MT_03240 [Candidatus Acidifodinimicrobium sp.]
MVNRRLKQFVAIFVAVAFVASIFLFIPKQLNNNTFSEYILVPTSLVQNQTAFSPYNSNLSVIGFVPPSIIGNLVVNSNLTNLAGVTSSMLSAVKLNYTLSNATICIQKGTYFTENLCDNSNYTWVMLENVSGTIQQLTSPLSSVDLNGLSSPSNYFYLIYEPKQTATASNSLPKL